MEEWAVKGKRDKEEGFGFKRSERMNRVLREELSDLILRELHDPRIGAVTLTEISTSDDLSNARVYFTTHEKDPEFLKQQLKGLASAASFLRGELGKRLHVRRIPQLHFMRDEAIEYGSHIEALLAGLTPAAQAPDEETPHDDPPEHE